MTLTAGYGFNEHEETWMLLPWLANGRLSGELRERALQHVKTCSACSAELDLQARLCAALAMPDERSVDPGAALARLMSRIDRASTAAPAPRARSPRRQARLAWAATVLVTGALAGGMLYRGMTPAYRMRSDDTGTPQVLHIAFVRELTIGDMEALLAAAGAQVVEGPGTGGVFGLRAIGSHPSAEPGQLQQLAARLRSDPRVRWVEPLAPPPDPRSHH